MAKAQIATLLTTEEPTITVSLMDVQMQSGGYDCGFFSIAFATALVFGEQPGYFLFEQTKIRAHILQCLMATNIYVSSNEKKHTGSGVEEVILRVLHARSTKLEVD